MILSHITKETRKTRLTTNNYLQFFLLFQLDNNPIENLPKRVDVQKLSGSYNCGLFHPEMRTQVKYSSLKALKKKSGSR